MTTKKKIIDLETTDLPTDQEVEKIPDPPIPETQKEPPVKPKKSHKKKATIAETPVQPEIPQAVAEQSAFFLAHQGHKLLFRGVGWLGDLASQGQLAFDVNADQLAECDEALTNLILYYGWSMGPLIPYLVTLGATIATSFREVPPPKPQKLIAAPETPETPDNPQDSI